jgi:hypothetical protein
MDLLFRAVIAAPHSGALKEEAKRKRASAKRGKKTA